MSAVMATSHAGTSVRKLAAGVVVTCAILAFVSHAIYRGSETRLNTSRVPRPITLATVASDDAITRGRHLSEAVAQCTFCHGDDWGGRLISDDWLVGRLYAPNLTSGTGGIADRYSDEDFARAVRYGRGPAGENLWFMPAEHFVALCDDDLAALIAYIRTLPPVDRETPARWPGPATRLAVVLGLAPELTVRDPIARPGGRQAPGHERTGEYLVSVGICGTCHRADLAGGRHPLAPPHEPVPPDITRSGAIARWSQADFLRAMRGGITPDGRLLDPVFMPWTRYAAMNDDELVAIFDYLTGERHPQPTTAVAVASRLDLREGAE